LITTARFCASYSYGVPPISSTSRCKNRGETSRTFNAFAISCEIRATGGQRIGEFWVTLHAAIRGLCAPPRNAGGIAESSANFSSSGRNS
jgi:hypothetical protein